MDKSDLRLLSALEQDSRVSLKNLAEKIDINTSTIYHRLHKLRENNILEKFTITINPKLLGLTHHSILNIRLKKMVVGKMDKMFLESFAKYLGEEFEELLFSGIGEDERIWCIITCRNEEHFEDFREKLEENPYIQDYELINLEKIMKGHKIFSINVGLIKINQDGEYFDDSKEEKIEDEETQDTTSEIIF